MRIAAAFTIAAVSACSDNTAPTPVPDTTPATIAVAQTSAFTLTITSGSAVTLSAEVRTAEGALLANQAVSWTTSDAAVVSISAGGVLHGLLAGHAQVAAKIGTLTSASVNVVVTPGSPSRLVVRTQPAGAASGVPLTTQPIIEVQDASGNLSATTTTVTAVIATGGGTITGSTTTATNGVATFQSLSLTGLVGDRTLSFSAPGLSSVTSAGFALSPGPAAALVIRTQPITATVGQSFTPVPVVELRDSAGNLATTSSLSVTASLGDGVGTLANATAVASKGLATFSDLSLNGAPGQYTLTFSASGTNVVTSASFTLAPHP